jgi:hypothetical protein
MRRPALLWMLQGVLVLASTLDSLAQNETDVLRYSWVDPLGSSRTMGLGGAFGALGADLGSMGVNPAGLGMYRRGDLAMTCGVLGSGTTSQWDFRQEGAVAYAVTASNVGIALTYPSVDADMPFFTLALGRQIRMPFAQRIRIDGVQSSETVSEVFVAQAIEDALEWGYVSTDEALTNGDIFSHGAALAWQAGVLLPDNENVYATAVNGPVQVSRLIEREGRMSETQIAFGSGFQEWFYFGATLGLPKVSFDERSTHTEAATLNESDLRSWTYQEDLAVNGRGWLLRGGVLFRVSEALRVGLSHQTRARLTLIDTYATDVTASWMDGSTSTASSPTSNYEYIVQTPSRTTASASFLMGKVGVINADYERTNVASGTLQDGDGFLSSGYDFAVENDAVAQAFQTSHAARVGLEFRAGDDGQWRIRGGGGMATSPFQGDAIVADATRFHASIGGGLRLGNVHVSAAWRTAWHQEDYYFMGALSSSAPGMLDRRSSILVFGAGLRM